MTIMRKSFNVLHDPWIPVICLDGTRTLLGIYDTLQQASILREISVDSWLEEFSLYRFLCVFLMDALRPEAEADLLTLIRKGSFEMSKIDAYIALCKSEGVSFDLFNKERPFLQSPYVEGWDTIKPIAYIDCMAVSGNNHMHFCHQNENDYSVTTAKAARLLLSCQIFATISIHGYRPGVNGTPPYFSVVKRPDLFHTLAFTLMPLDQIDIPFDDPPVIWRSTEPVHCNGGKDPLALVESTSWLRTMFFPARRVKLFPPTTSGKIEKICYAAGENYVGTEWTDPFVPYRTTKDGRFPIRPHGLKPVWRSMYDLLDTEEHHAPLLLSQYVRLSGDPYTEMTLYGVETDKAKYIQCIRHDVRFCNDILWNVEALFLLKQCIEAAELLANRIRRSLGSVTEIPVVMRDSAVSQFYERTEERFWLLCENASVCSDTMAQYQDWCTDIGQYAMDAYNDILSQMRLRGRNLAKAANQQNWLSYQIWQLKNPKKEE